MGASVADAILLWKRFIIQCRYELPERIRPVAHRVLRRGLHFAGSLAIAWPNDGQAETFDGRVDGILVWPPRGSRGFGYDPMFVPVGHEETFGEMEPAAKHAMSHRADAFRKLVAALNDEALPK